MQSRNQFLKILRLRVLRFISGPRGVKKSSTRKPLQYWSDGDDVNALTYALKKKYTESMIDGTRITKKDSKLLFPAYGLTEVSAKQKIVIDGVEQNVIDVQAIEPGNVPLIYEAQIRS